MDRVKLSELGYNKKAPQKTQGDLVNTCACAIPSTLFHLKLQVP